ncbi:MAG: hypothetical protein JKY54_13725, partial [Flavobacteriales bacterium]|nr:hypothetical protein [Flavobacteriales bacterium]
AEWDPITRYLNDDRLDDVVAHYGSLHNERWEIIGEFPLTHKDVIDGQGNPDTSWAAKIPAETPFFIQTLDKNGMTLVSELTWRSLKSGENRTDCGGCHAHSVEPLDFSTTQAGLQAPIEKVAGVAEKDARIADGMWDLTQGIPLLSSSGVTFSDSNSLDVEFNRDVLPILNANCVSCHTGGGSNGGLILDGTGNDDPWGVLTNKNKSDGGMYSLPQRSKYIRIPQARESLLVWVAYGQRLDGRSNSDRVEDVDYPQSHPSLTLTDFEKRMVARWVDLGGAIDFPDPAGFGYTNDNQLPVINVFRPKRGYNESTNSWSVGFADAKSGVDLSTLEINYAKLIGGVPGAPVEITVTPDLVNSAGVIHVPAPGDIEFGSEYLITVSVRDLAGNLAFDKRKVVFSEPPSPPKFPKNIIIGSNP